MQVSILSGSYADAGIGLRTKYPINYRPVFSPSGASSGYLRPCEGLVSDGSGNGTCRGGINWNGVWYAVFGSSLCSVSSSGTVSVLGSVGSDGQPVSMDYSFNELCVVSNGNAFYWDGSTLTQITDPDLGTVYDVIFIDGYFMFSDSENLLVSDIGAPTSINPLKYGSSEVDPDDIQGILKIRNEVYAINENTIEVFDNTGSSGFPFQRIDSAQIPKGAVGRKAFCKHMEAVAFVGSDRNEPPSVYLGFNGRAERIATKEIDEVLMGYSKAQLEDIVVESRKDKNSDMVYIHLPDQTLVYDSDASKAFGAPVWFILSSGIGSLSKFRGRFFVYAYDRWNVTDTDSATLGHFTDDVGSHWGETITWEFGTSIVYNENMGVVMNEIELVALPGRIALGDEPQISTSYSKDLVNWSQDRFLSVGKIGDRLKRLVWRRQGSTRNYRVQRFRGDSKARISFLRLEVQAEPLGA